jgi:DNA-binding NtrC family response regulator
VAVPNVLIVGKGGATARRVRTHLMRAGHRVQVVPDCGVATEALRQEAFAAVLLDVETSGFGAPAFREMLQEEYPDLPLLDLPPGDARPETVGLLVGALEQGLREHGAERREGEAADAFDTPLLDMKFEDLTSRNPRMKDLFALIPRVAQSDTPVLIVGETGTGKELVAAAIHRHSRRRDREFFTINCGALTESLLESELFGHEKGSFTGAFRTKKGYFELASGGSLFLDELGTITAAMQVKLLRVLERMEVRRVGGSTLVPVDVRIVAATNASLEEAVAAGTFREDLYYRLNVVQLQIPPLRERSEDVPLLAEIFRKKFAAEQSRTEVARIDRPAMKLLQSYPWPGNVRELENVIERAVLMTATSAITERELPERLKKVEAKRIAVPAFDADEPLETVIDRVRLAVEREYLRRILRRYRGHVGKVSEHAGLNRRTLYNKMQVHGLKKEDFQG